jgi:hypothetical protein
VSLTCYSTDSARSGIPEAEVTLEMAYIAPIHRPSSVRRALKLNLLGADEESLVVA